MNAAQLLDEIRLQLMRKISNTEQAVTQHELADHAGISPKQANYWIAKMVKDGLVKMERWEKAGIQTACAYTLTPKGEEEKFSLLVDYWNRKLQEYTILRNEVDALHQEILQYGPLQQHKDPYPRIQHGPLPFH